MPAKSFKSSFAGSDLAGSQCCKITQKSQSKRLDLPADAFFRLPARIFGLLRRYQIVPDLKVFVDKFRS
jgi:hypothetical protein